MSLCFVCLLLLLFYANINYSELQSTFNICCRDDFILKSTNSFPRYISEAQYF